MAKQKTELYQHKAETWDAKTCEKKAKHQAYVALTAVGQSKQGDALEYRNWQVAAMMKNAFEAGMRAEQEKKRN